MRLRLSLAMAILLSASSVVAQGTLSASPSSIPAGGTVSVTYENSNRTSAFVSITVTSGSAVRSFIIETDGAGNGTADFTLPAEWSVSATFSVDDAPDALVVIQPPDPA